MVAQYPNRILRTPYPQTNHQACQEGGELGVGSWAVSDRILVAKLYKRVRVYEACS
jgi:hypothetical protein